MINTTTTNTLHIVCDGMPVTEIPTPAETQADLIVENANLRQENTELHELIGVQRQKIETLQRQARKLHLLLMHAQGATSLLLAALQIPDDDEPTAY